ncbi:HD-GYP domain-containing protein [Roseibium sp.]|uniref:HD-GYP domain-containing protein n=1 Tax=Roseibium sp. TaxID=1936156 RepID=UPI003A975F36
MRAGENLSNLHLAELIGALSHALDMTEGQPRGHCVRSCWIGVRVGTELGLDASLISDIYFTTLLKDLGCSSNAARICELYLTDDITFKHDFKLINGSLSQALRFVMTHTGLKAGLAERFRAIINILQNGSEIASELIDTRCQRGADIAARMGFGANICDGIRSLDEHWDGGGKPQGLTGGNIPVQSQIALLAQVTDVFHLNSGAEAALREIRDRSGSWFSPRVVAAFEAAAGKPDFWSALSSPDIEARVHDLPPGRDIRPVNDDQLDDIAAGFALVIDSKSPFTAGHSERVTLYTDVIASELGYSDADRQILKRAALLHDIGKLGVSNQILDKPGRLDPAEWEQIRLHTVYSSQILSKVKAFEGLLPVARGHHERLDGKGYPDGLKGDQISMETRIVTVADIFDALTADRPYRTALPVHAAFKILEDDVGSAIDGRCLDALKNGLSRLNWELVA